MRYFFVIEKAFDKLGRPSLEDHFFSSSFNRNLMDPVQHQKGKFSKEDSNPESSP
jgi:hypothetical protein